MLCGRQTKAKTPCKASRPSNYHFACRSHATEDEHKYGELIFQARMEGWREGHDNATALSAIRIERLERQIAELRESADSANRRFRDGRGRQIVQIGGYSYAWGGDEPLAVGDEVMLPENFVSAARVGPGPWRGTVSALGSTYAGHVSAVLRRA